MASASAPPIPNPTTPVFEDDLEWFTAYAVIHMLSNPSRRVTYILWIVIGILVLIYAALHILLPLGGGALGARWSKFALRRRTWRKQHSLEKARRQGKPHKQPLPLPSNAQLLSFVIIIIATLCFMFVGPDYIAPSKSIWSFSSRDLRTRASGGYSLATFYPLQPQYTIPKAWWTSGGRAGLIAFALFPLCVLFALKAPPFALFANSWTVQLHFDKLSWLHRWSGRLIWFVAAVHTTLWSVQLSTDRHAGTGHIAYQYAWGYSKFIYAWIAFGFLTALVLLSLRPFRDHFYETFYFMHVACVLGTLVFSALHHPPVWWWCWAALMLWAGERLWRLTYWLYANGFVGSTVAEPTVGHIQPFDVHRNKYDPNRIEALLPAATSPNTPYNAHSPMSASRHQLLVPPSTTSTYIPPTGFAHVELLAGRTVRLTLATPGYISWAPGQHFLICVPSVSRFLSHPFTCSSLCDEQIPGPEGRTLIFYIRAKRGWTRDLWDYTVALLSAGQKHPANERHALHALPPTGVLMRTWVDGPFGSCARTEWGAYSTALIISGGSGVSFALAVLEYTCLCMAGRNGRFLGGKVKGPGTNTFKTDRIRFIWIMREFSHLQWAARVIRRCQGLISPDHLQIDIFVTNTSQALPLTPVAVHGDASTDTLVPPTPAFATSSHPADRSRPSSIDSVTFSVTDEILDDYVDTNYHRNNVHSDMDGLGHEAHILDFTNFDGDDDERLPGEKDVSHTIRKESRIRRAQSRVKRLSKDATNNGRSSLYPPSEHQHGLSSDSLNPSRQPNLRVETRLQVLNEEPLTPVPPLRKDSPDPSRRASSIYSAASAATSQNWESMHRTSRPMSTGSTISRALSIRPLMPRVGHGAHGQTVALELDDQELSDMRAMAEFTHPGRPKLDMILRDEVRIAHGAIVVACCGPTTLNAVVRKTVAAQIDPDRIRRGDMTGSISLVAEDFEY